MKTELNTEKKNNGVNSSETEQKRAFLTVEVTPEQKLQVTKEAVEVCQTTVSDYCRTKIFMSKQENQTEIDGNGMSDEERKIYDETIIKLKKENNFLKEQNTQLKVEASTPGLQDEITALKEENENLKAKIFVSESDLYQSLTPDENKLINDVIKLYNKKVSNLVYENSETLLKKELSHLLSKTERYMDSAYKTEGTNEFNALNTLKEKLAA